jgi:GAF domain-containing protein
MVAWIQRILAAPVFKDDEEKTRTAGLLNVVALACALVALAIGVAAPFVFARPDIALASSSLVLFLALVSIVLMWRGYVQLASVLLLFGLWTAFTILMFLSGGVTSVFAMGYVTATMLAGLLLGGQVAIVVAGFSLVASLVMVAAKVVGVLPESVLTVGEGPAWANLAANLAAAVTILYLATRSVGQALERARRSAAELTKQSELLEDMVAARTRDLEQRAAQLATAADVGRAAASILELESLSRRVVELVRDRFELYYAGLFLLDEEGRHAVLVAGTGEAGRLMREQGHRLEVGGRSMVGAACAQRQPRLALDVGEESVRFDNPLLPHTRSEMALPLVVGDRALGALDVQSVDPAAFSEEDVAVLQLVADQVAVAVDNALKFSEEAALLEATNPLFRVSRRLVSVVTTAEITEAVIASVAETEADGCIVGWLNYAPDGNVESITFLGDWNRQEKPRYASGVTFLRESSPLPLQVAMSFWTVGDAEQDTRLPQDLRVFITAHGGRGFVNVPLRLGSRIVGFVSIYRAEPGPFSPVSIRLYETLVDQAAVAMERARLLDEAERRVSRERLVADISGRMRETLDVRTVLKTAVEEIADVLGLAALDLQLSVDNETEGEMVGTPGILSLPEEK